MPTIRLPWPPSVNNYWRECVRFRSAFSRKGAYVHVAVGDDGLRFRHAVKDALIARLGKKPRASRARMRVRIVLHLPDRRARDLDNILKATLDALTHARVWHDDSQIDDLEVIRGPVEPPGHLEVTIERISEEPAVQKTLLAVEATNGSE